MFSQFILAFTMVFSLYRKKTDVEDPAMYLKMLLLGVTCVLMLVEVASKYTTAFTLPFVSIALLEYRNAYDYFKALSDRLRKNR